MYIQVKNASKKIKGATILQNINLDLHGGIIYGLQGPNGSGKTMLMRLIAGLIRPTSGSVVIDGKQLGKDIDFPPSMGLLIENPAFLPNYTGFKNLELIADIQRRIGKAERDHGALIVLASHDPNLLESIADEIYTIHEGTLQRRLHK